MLKDDIINALIFQQRLLFAHSNNTDEIVEQK